jgi:peptidoglycan lytic transglycosylase
VNEPIHCSHQLNKRADMAGHSLAKLVLAATLVVPIAGVPMAASAQSGIASIYWGGRTASGERVRSSELTAAHRTLPLGTMVRVTNRGTGRSVVVRINDRGPFKRGRIIDVTVAAARALGFSVSSGLAPVTVAVLKTP